MHTDSISLSHKKTFSGKQSTINESLSYTISETSAQSGRRAHERTVIFPSRFDFALVIIGLQSGVRQLMFIFMQVQIYGAFMIFISTFVITISIALPLMVQQIFYGSYNKYGFIKFWNLAPVAIGIGLSMALYSVYECVSWSAIAALLILHIGHIPFRGISDWTTCQKIDRPDGMLCYDVFSKWPNTSCDLTTYPGWEFHNKIAYGPQDNNRINGPWFLCCIIVWVIVFVMVSQGFRQLKNILIKVPIICLLSLTLLIIVSFATQGQIVDEHRERLLRIDESPSRFTMVWLVWHSIRVIQIPLGTLCQLGSYSPPGTPLLADSVMILVFSCLYNAAFSYFAQCCHTWVEDSFRNVEPRCLAMDGMAAFYASVPTAISFLAMGNLWLFVYFAGFALKSILHIVITLTATMNAMSETFHLHRHRQQIVAVICTLALLLNLPITMMHSADFFHYTNRFVEFIVDLTIVSLSSIVVVCLYDLERVFDDMHFFYNVEPVLFQKCISYFSPVLMVFTIITAIATVITTWPSHPAFLNQFWAGLFVGLTVVFILAPIPAFALYVFIVHLTKRNISAILQPTSSWGPPETEVKRARRNFNPRSELRYKSKKPCAHNCLLNNLRIKIEVEKRDTQRKEFFLSVFQRPSFAEWDDDEDWRYGGDIIEKARAVDWTGDFGTNHPIMAGGRRVLSLMTAMERNEDQQESKNNGENDEEIRDEEIRDEGAYMNSERNPENNVKVKRDDVSINVTLVKPFLLTGNTLRETEFNFEPDIILPDSNSAELRPRIPPLGTYDLIAHRTLRSSPRYTSQHSKYRYRKKFTRDRPIETLIEPVRQVINNLQTFVFRDFCMSFLTKLAIDSEDAPENNQNT